MSVTVLYTFCFAYSKLSVIDECYCLVRRFHHILLVIIVDIGRVDVMDSKHMEHETWAPLQAALQR